MVYVAPNDEDFPSLDQPTKILYGNKNIVRLTDIDVPIISGKRYKWRVDCVEGNKEETKERRTGDVWLFTMND